MSASVGLCPSCSAALGQRASNGEAGASHAPVPVNAGVEIAPRTSPAQVAKYVGIAIGSAILLGIVAALIFAAGQGELPDGAASSDPDVPAAYEDDFLSESEETLYVTASANARDLPTTKATEILRAYTAGDRVEGRWVLGVDQTTRWLRISDDDPDGAGVAYVWDGNLGIEPPVTRGWLIGGAWSFAGHCEGTDHVIRFEPGGTFITSGVSGSFSVSGDSIRLRIDHDGGSPTTPTDEVFQVIRLGDDRARFDYGDGDAIEVPRCR